MQRVAILLTLLAALTGTPLRQAEAASDLSRSLAESSRAANLASPDGGVGDDSGVGTLTTPHVHAHATDAPSTHQLDSLPPLATTAFSTRAERGLHERVWWPQAPPGLRHAWLQVFLF